MPLIITPDNSVKIDQIQDVISNFGVSQLADVDLGSLANGKILKYNGVLGVWECVDDQGGLADVTGLGNYFRAAGVWVSGTVENLNNVGVSTPLPGQVLGYDGVNWTNQDVPLEAPIDGLKYARKDEAWEEVKDYRNLNDLEDVNFPVAPVLSDVLKYNTGTTQWEAGKLALGNLSNVFYTTPNNLDVLQFKTSNPSGSPAWVPSTLTIPTTLDSLTNVVAPTPTLNDVLSFDGTNWINAAGGSGTSLATLSDVNFGTLANGDFLTYDLPSTKWVNSGVSLTGYAAEYLQFKSLTGTCEISPNTVGEFGISSAIGFFTSTPTSGTCIFDTSASAGIISVINTK